jgi:hypothetical protein
MQARFLVFFVPVVVRGRAGQVHRAEACQYKRRKTVRLRRRPVQKKNRKRRSEAQHCGTQHAGELVGQSIWIWEQGAKRCWQAMPAWRAAWNSVDSRILAEPGEESRAEIPGIWIGKMYELRF